MPYKDPEKARACNRASYAKHRKRRVARVRTYKAEKHAILEEIKRKPCADCGQSYPPYVMDFDHRENKRFNLSRAVDKTGWQKTLDEIKKCDVVCANCHRERTHNKRAALV